MAWHKPAGSNGAKSRRGAPRSGGQGGGLWRRWRQRWAARPRARAPFYIAATALALLYWLASGFYQVEDGERGVLQRFGAFERERGSGAGWHLPWPIETMTIVDLGRLNNADFQSRMLTSDGMLLNITADITYRYTGASAALFTVRHPDALVRELGEAVLREFVGQQPIAGLMAGTTRAPISVALRAGLQRVLDQTGVGAQIADVNLTDVQVPEAVLAAQRDRVQADSDNERAAREAQGYAAELIPSAQALAQKQRLEAAEYKLQAISVAEGEAAHFAPIAAAYARAPAVMRNQMYIETIESILARSRKVVIDGKGINTMLLPLDKVGNAAALKAAGVQGIATVPANSESAATLSSAAPTGAAAAAAPPADSASSDDARGRERETRK
jgi:membrane protease subunit HflK